MLLIVRTSTLKIGDGVVAINGIELEDKSSEQVDRLLALTQQRPTAVLTVCRTVTASAAASTINTGEVTIQYTSDVDVDKTFFSRPGNQDQDVSGSTKCFNVLDYVMLLTDVTRRLMLLMLLN